MPHCFNKSIVQELGTGDSGVRITPWGSGPPVKMASGTLMKQQETPDVMRLWNEQGAGLQLY